MQPVPEECARTSPIQRPRPGLARPRVRWRARSRASHPLPATRCARARTRPWPARVDRGRTRRYGAAVRARKAGTSLRGGAACPSRPPRSRRPKVSRVDFLRGRAWLRPSLCPQSRFGPASWLEAAAPPLHAACLRPRWRAGASPARPRHSARPGSRGQPPSRPERKPVGGWCLGSGGADEEEGQLNCDGHQRAESHSTSLYPTGTASVASLPPPLQQPPPRRRRGGDEAGAGRARGAGPRRTDAQSESAFIGTLEYASFVK